jgi:putative ABC transport system permease protein
LNLPVFSFATIASLFSGIFFGLAPALAAFRAPVMETIKESGSTSASSLRTRRFQGLFVVAEVALALVLFIGAGLLLRSFLQLSSVPPGFDPAGVLVGRVSLPMNFYETREKQLTFFRELEMKLGALPGVDSVGLANTLPLQGVDLQTFFQRNDQPPAPLSAVPSTPAVVVSPGYFSTLHIPLIEGRLLNANDTNEAANSLLINQAFARRYFPNDEPIGHQLRTGRGEIWTIVGVVGDSRQRGLGAPVESEIFVPVEKWCPPELAFLLRTRGDPESLIASARTVVASIDKNIPIFGAQAATALLKGETESQRFNSALLLSFALFAVLLAAMGVYGVMAYAVHQRVREVGIRLAIGAKPRDVLWLILSHGFWLALVGLFVGVVGSLALTRLMTSLLFSVRATDPLTYTAASLLLASAVVAACYFPARRAMHIDPMIALRHE